MEGAVSASAKGTDGFHPHSTPAGKIPLCAKSIVPILHLHVIEPRNLTATQHLHACH